MKLAKGSFITILVGQNDEWMIPNNNASTPPYVHQGQNIQVQAQVFELTENDEVSLDTSNVVNDGSGNVFKMIIGPRPRNIIRR